MIKVNTKELLQALNRLNGVIEKSKLPILKTVKINAIGDSVSFTVTDLDVEVETSINAEIEDDFSICTPYEKLLKLAKFAKTDSLIIKISDEISKDSIDFIKLIVNEEKREYFLSGNMMSSEFPRINTDTNSYQYESNFSQFASDLALVAPAMLKEETRYYLNGIFFEFPKNEGESINLVATDGHRLYRNKLVATSKRDDKTRSMVQLFPQRQSIIWLGLVKNTIQS